MSNDATSQDAPRFAVVGRVNRGKSSILATLVEETDNEVIRVSNVQGETTRCYPIPLKLNGEKLIEFIDTPGFSRARHVLAWLRENHEEGSGVARIETVRAFVKEHRDGAEFPDECELLKPVLAGAGIVYIVDPSEPFRPDFAAEMEILRWTGRPRMAVLNQKSGDHDFSDEWRDRLGEFFNLTRDFNAHRAQFRERIRLLRHLLEIEDGGREKIEKTIRLLESEWDQRRGEAADSLVKLIESAITHQTCKAVGDERVARDYKRAQVEEELKEAYRRELRELEAIHHEELSKLYRHEDVEIVDSVNAEIDGEDLFAEETWQVLGLEPGQLAVAGGIAGASVGGGIDLIAGGTLIGVPTLLGAAGGYLTAVWKGKDLADIKIKKPGSITGAESSLGGVKICAGPPKNPNFGWILLDRFLFHYEHLVTRSHGRRDRFVIDFSQLSDSDHKAYTAKFSREKRGQIQRWFVEVSKKNRDFNDGDVFEILRETLSEIEEGDLRAIT